MNNKKIVYVGREDILDIKYRNFSGRPDDYNKNGAMPNATLVITPAKASELSEKGFNIREYINKDGDPEYRLKVFARFDKFPPKIVKVCGKKRIPLNEETIGSLDNDEIEGIDLSINPYYYSISSDREGIKAYITAGLFYIVQDEIDLILERLEEDDEKYNMPFGE